MKSPVGISAAFNDFIVHSGEVAKVEIGVQLLILLVCVVTMLTLFGKR